MNYIPYSTSTGQSRLLAGEGAIDCLISEIISCNSRKPLIISDNRARKKSSFKILLKAFRDSGLTIGAHFDRVPEKTSITLIRSLATLFRDRGCDMLIALGSGSVMNTAKGLNIYISEKKDPILYAEEATSSWGLRPWIAVPSMPVDGLELTQLAEIERRIFKLPSLAPKTVIIDPAIYRSEDHDQLHQAFSIAAAQAIDILWDQESDPFRDAYASATLRLLKKAASLTLSGDSSRASIALGSALFCSSRGFGDISSPFFSPLAKSIHENLNISHGISIDILLSGALGKLCELNLDFRNKIFKEFSTIASTSVKIPTDPSTLINMILKSILIKNPDQNRPSFKNLDIPWYRLEEIARIFAQKDEFLINEENYINIIHECWVTKK